MTEINVLETAVKIFGGLGLFIYGMNVMAEGLENAAGNKMRNIIEILTKNRFLAVFVGAVVTAIVQSSSATTVMVVGFVMRNNEPCTVCRHYYGCKHRYYSNCNTCLS